MKAARERAAAARSKLNSISNTLTGDKEKPEPGVLTAEEFSFQAGGREGLPPDARALAYDAAAGVLAVAGGDGALKVFGRPGVEEPLGRGTYKDPSRSRSRSRRWLRVP